MPEQGKKQMPAGVDKSPKFVNVGERTMLSANAMMKLGFSIKNCDYKGNATLNAND
tara:strand:- start:607 stop:774 length:168 start_codon:yes stop_codon:yes gene_type:complete